MEVDLTLELLKHGKRFHATISSDTDTGLKVMSQCHEVLNTWDDEYDRLQGLMRDIFKKKRDEHLKMVWKVNISRKWLQERILGECEGGLGGCHEEICCQEPPVSTRLSPNKGSRMTSTSYIRSSKYNICRPRLARCHA